MIFTTTQKNSTHNPRQIPASWQNDKGNHFKYFRYVSHRTGCWMNYFYNDSGPGRGFNEIEKYLLDAIHPGIVDGSLLGDEDHGRNIAEILMGLRIGYYLGLVKAFDFSIPILIFFKIIPFRNTITTIRVKGQ